MEKRIPTSSQTVGPFFMIGLNDMIDRMAAMDAVRGDLIEIRGRVLDRDGSPVPDAMLEFWQAADGSGDVAMASLHNGIPGGFRRVATDVEGRFAVRITKPTSIRAGDGEQAPQCMVLVFARGLQRHLLSRVYLEGERKNEHDPVLLSIPVERRGTLIAQADGTRSYRWDVVLQGANETVFFAW